MAAPPAPGQLLWTALPAGTDGVSTLSLSVVVTPQLVSDDPAATLADFTSFANAQGGWTTLVQAQSFTITFPAANYSTTAQPLTTNLQPSLWAALFPDTLSAGQFTYDAASDVQAQVQQGTQSYSVVNNFRSVVEIYRPPWHPPGTPTPMPQIERQTPPSTNPRASSQRLTLAHFAHLVPDSQQDRIALRETVRTLRAKHGVLHPHHFVEAAQQDPRFTPEMLHFAQAQDFYAGLAAGAQARYQVAQPLTPIVFDFHAALTAISRYPSLMRALGLVLDFQLPVDADTLAQLTGAGTISITPTDPTPFAGLGIVSPITPYTLTPASSLFVLGASTAMPELSNGFFSVPADSALPYSLRLDALMQELPNAVAQFKQQAERKAATLQPADTTTAPTAPALTTSGLSLARSGDNGLIVALENMITAQANLSASATPDAPTLVPESVIRGFRVDIQPIEPAAPGAWMTLHARDGSYTFNTTGSTQTWTDEGWVTLQAFNAGLDGPGASLWTHETIFLWQGWSLSAPRPGMISDSNGNLIAQDDPQIAGSNLGLTVSFEPHPGSLPLLRLGSTYNSRLRAVDLAGNSLPLSAPVDPASVTSLGAFLRFDPVKAPVLVARDPMGPGESSAIIALRSDVNAPATTNAERLLAPPATSLQMAEWHGALDIATPAGTTPNPNLFADPTFIQRLGATFSTTPYGTTPPAVPYLPDPAATSILLDFTPDPTDTTSPVTQAPLNGTWPAINPYRLLLQEGVFNVAVDPVAFTITVSLPKAAVYTINLVSGVSAPPTDGSQGGITLFDYWNAAVNGSVSSNDLATLQTSLLNGRIAQVTPPQSVQLIHAVQRPLIVSVFADGASVSREANATWAVVVANVSIDGPSTAKADLMANWTEWFDDGINAPYQNTYQAHVASQTFLTTDTAWDSLWEIDAPQNWMQHEFHDTRARAVTYTVTSTTRFQEFFPTTLTADPANITQTSAPITLNVPCSSYPPAPRVLYVIPTFGWTATTNDDGSLTRQRTCGLRVYLDRPWYASGDGEQLGVVIPVGIPPTPPDPGNGGPKHPIPVPPVGPGPRPVLQAVRLHPLDDTTPPLIPSPLAPGPISTAVEPFVTQWGLDGATVADGTLPQQYAPMPQNFPNGTLAYVNPWSFSDTSGFSEQFAVVGFPVQFDPPDSTNPAAPADPDATINNGRWYTDIELDTGGAYLPFIRLALVRYQSLNTTQPAYSCSPIVLADFTQIPAGRSASISFDPNSPQQVTVAVTGPANAPSADPNDPNVNREGSSFFAYVEIDYGSDASSLWIAQGTVQLSVIVGLQNAWSATLPLPVARGVSPMRVVLLEYEEWPTDQPDRNAAEAASQATRLMYADTFTL